MQAPIFSICEASAQVTALIGASPVRLYEFGRAPQGVTKPYAVWQVIGGSPENYLAGRPDVNGYRLQVDAFATTSDQAKAVQDALEYAIELNAHVVSYNGESEDPETKLRRSSFDVHWFVNR
jgi:hypothetical protein